MGNIIKRTTLLLFALVSCQLAFCQLTKIKSVDTIQVTGKVLFIDSLCDMSNVSFVNRYPYYLILVEPDTFSERKFNIRYRIAIRWFSNIYSIKINTTQTFIVKRTEYDELRIPGDVINMQTATESILNQIDKSNLISIILTRLPCYDYSLKENLYVRYEQIDKRF